MNDPFIYLQYIRKILLPMSGVTEGKAYGTPAFHVKKKMMVRLWDDGETLVVYNEERDKWMDKDPAIFFITDHYLNYPYVLVRLTDADPADLEQLLIDAWFYRAPATLIKAYKADK